MVLDGKFSQEYPATSEFLNVLFMVLHFSEYTLITFLMILSLMLLVMLMILLSTLSVIRNRICGSN